MLSLKKQPTSGQLKNMLSFEGNVGGLLKIKNCHVSHLQLIFSSSQIENSNFHNFFWESLSLYLYLSTKVCLFLSNYLVTETEQDTVGLLSLEAFLERPGYRITRPADILILTATPPLKHCCKTPHQIFPGWDTQFWGAWAHYVPLCLPHFSASPITLFPRFNSAPVDRGRVLGIRTSVIPGLLTFKELPVGIKV